MEGALRHLLVLITIAGGLAAAQPPADPAPDVLPAPATLRLDGSLRAARAHDRHVWRDTPPAYADGSVTAYIEIPRGDRRKWEFDMGANARVIDRVMPKAVGGYPVNYGFVPQTVSYDGDPFDALVLGPPIEGGETIRGVVVGVMYMEDEKGLDSKVVLSRPSPAGEPLHRLTDGERRRIAGYFRRYKAHEPGAFSKVPGWGSADEGRALVAKTHAFFLKCRAHAPGPCRLAGR